MRLTSQNVLHFGIKFSKSRRFLGLRPRPHWGSLRRSPDPLIVRGFLPLAIAASRLRRLHFPQFSRFLSPQVLHRFSPLLLTPLPLSQTVTLSRTPSPSSVTYFMDDPLQQYVHAWFSKLFINSASIHMRFLPRVNKLLSTIGQEKETPLVWTCGANTGAET